MCSCIWVTYIYIHTLLHVGSGMRIFTDVSRRCGRQIPSFSFQHLSSFREMYGTRGRRRRRRRAGALIKWRKTKRTCALLKWELRLNVDVWNRTVEFIKHSWIDVENNTNKIWLCEIYLQHTLYFDLRKRWIAVWYFNEIRRGGLGAIYIVRMNNLFCHPSFLLVLFLLVVLLIFM